MKILGFVALFIILFLIVFIVAYCLGHTHGVKDMTDLFIKKQKDEESEDTEWADI